MRSTSSIGMRALFPIMTLLAAMAATAMSKPAAAPARVSGENWKVDDAHGPASVVTFTTDEGTWMSLDVHPAGDRIVFSLLGDLYLLPIGGGEARRITSGPSYDVQPRFSPDGKWIAFTSDRSGIENIWICDLEGSNSRAISTEKEKTVSAPEWSPSGDYIVGRKRTTDTSSIGTIDLYMWHIKGGLGVQITKREDQPDAADLEFSPDGRFLYFSARDSRYRYDRNVDEGIWQIKRLDLRNNQTVPLSQDWGGMAAPRISPDGKLMAYVRRVRTQTRLELMDLATGSTRVLAPAVQRDMQEGFADHGVFPGYAWTPDGGAVVATAEGRIWKWELSTGNRTLIPFTAAVEQRVSQALRTPRPAVQDMVRARIVQWPVESSDGETLAFSALGHLYTMALPGGTPKRLTAGDDLEFSPAWSPDGKEVAYVTWNDKSYGQVWAVTAEVGSVPRRVTTNAGQYANPSFSPDGSKIAYLKGSGVTARGYDLGEEIWHEVQWVEAGGGAGHFVVGTKNRGSNRRMARPFFSRDGERIFYLEDDKTEKPTEVPKAILVSVKLDGTDRRVHMRWGMAEEALVSPDGRWVAFMELHNAYVAAFPEWSGQTVEASLTDAPLPLCQLSDEGGEWVSWSSDSHRVGWIFGTAYHRLTLEKAFAQAQAEEKKKPAGAKNAPPATEEAKKLPESERIEIKLEVPRARPSGLVAYTGARIVTMKGDEVIERGTIVVDADRIVNVGAEGQVSIPAGARTVDAAGRTIIPGLFDEHAHLHYTTLDILPQRPWKYMANLAYGVTTTHDPSAATHEVFAQAEMVEAGLMTGPRIYSTGFVLYGADDPSRAQIKSLDDARRHVRRLKALGAMSVKSYMQPGRDQRQWVIQAAREEGLMVVPEGGGNLEADMTMVIDGHTTLEHSLPVTPLRKDVVTLLARSGTAYTPTLLVAYGGLSGDKWFFQHYDIWKDTRLLRFVPQSVVDRLGRIRSVMAPDDEWHHIDVATSAKKVVDAGGRVCLGGHGQMQGLGPHWEIWAFVQGGMTPLQALRVATLAPAQALGLDRDLGSIEPGKLADFVVLERNPLEKIENTDSVEMVVKNGVGYRPEDLRVW
ncbi:MAG: PD40 domain-containing protein [Acidobacteria bacterium]|nr:PD40 domain-containing protein [Acidobacteriota bacterium]